MPFPLCHRFALSKQNVGTVERNELDTSVPHAVDSTQIRCDSCSRHLGYEVCQAQGVVIVCWITMYIGIRTNAPTEPDRITLLVAPDSRFVVAAEVVVRPRFRIKVLAGIAQIEHVTRRWRRRLLAERIALIRPYVGCGQIDQAHSIRQGFLYVFEGIQPIYRHDFG
jgi:hypothetical protein